MPRLLQEFEAVTGEEIRGTHSQKVLPMVA
jgi:hypothetical protein